MTTGVNHITISVSDIGRSLDFYSRVLGIHPVATWSVGAYLLAGETWIALVQESSVARRQSEEYSHIAFTVAPESLRSASDLVLKEGASVWKQNTTEGDSLYFLDPDGHKLEIHASDLRARLEHMHRQPWEGILFHDQQLPSGRATVQGRLNASDEPPSPAAISKESSMVTLETTRLQVRDHLGSDLADLHRLLSDVEVMRYLPEIRCTSLSQSERNLREAIEQARRADRSKYFFAIIEKRSSRYVGEVGFTILKPGVGGLGYFIHREFWGRGYMTEVVRAVLALAFGMLSLHKITSGCLSENIASERIMVKCGMRKEAYLREHSYHEGVWKDRVEYGILEEDWIALSQSVSADT